MAIEHRTVHVPLIQRNKAKEINRPAHDAQVKNVLGAVRIAHTYIRDELTITSAPNGDLFMDKLFKRFG